MESDREAKLEQLLAITATMPEDRHGRSSMEEILRDNDWDVEVSDDDEVTFRLDFVAR